jgi:ketosteroid isomerase-like protein
MTVRLAPVLAAACLALPLAACGPKMIGRTTIEDSSDNRAILEVVQQYRVAYEAKDSQAIMKLASPRYLDQRDSISFDTLQSSLQKDFERVKQLQLELTVRRIEVDQDRAQVHYFYSTSFQLAGNEQWTTETDDKKMILAREDGAWRVLSGL